MEADLEQDQAKRLVQAHLDELQLRWDRDKAQKALDQNHVLQRALEKELAKTVGTNIDTRVWHVCAVSTHDRPYVVIAKYQAGVGVYPVQEQKVPG